MTHACAAQYHSPRPQPLRGPTNIITPLSYMPVQRNIMRRRWRRRSKREGGGGGGAGGGGGEGEGNPPSSLLPPEGLYSHKEPTPPTTTHPPVYFPHKVSPPTRSPQHQTQPTLAGACIS
jgi:hypothetical protein